MPAKGIWIAMPVATKQFPDGWWSLAVKAGICAHGDSKEAAERRFDEALTLWAASAPSTEVLLARLRAAGIHVAGVTPCLTATSCLAQPLCSRKISRLVTRSLAPADPGWCSRVLIRMVDEQLATGVLIRLGLGPKIVHDTLIEYGAWGWVVLVACTS